MGTGSLSTRSRAAAVLCALIGASGAFGALAAAGAQAAGPGETFLVGGLPLPPGALVGGGAGARENEPEGGELSDDGRYVAFIAAADTLAPDAPLEAINVFRKDRVTGEVTLVNRATGATGAPGDGDATAAVISDDGSRVAFLTTASLDPADGGADWDLYVRDLPSATTFAPTADVAGDVTTFDLSGDGRTVAFGTAARVVAGDLNTRQDLYRRPVAGGAPLLVTRRAGSAEAGDGDAWGPSLSDDGRWVAFASRARDLVGGYSGSGQQIFVRDMQENTTTRLVSNATGTAATASNGEASDPDVAGAPGAGIANVVVAYDSDATDLSADDGATDSSVFVRRFSDGPTAAARLVSRATGAGGANADSRAHTPSISDDGSRVAFSTDATNLGAGDDYYGVYVRDTTANTTVLGSAANSYAVWGVIAGGGGALAWFEQAGLAPGGDPDLTGVLVRDYASPPTAMGAVELASRPPGVAPFLAPAAEFRTTEIGAQAISADGRHVVFAAASSRLPAAGDGTPIYRRDTATGETVLISRADGHDGAPGSGSAVEPSISADGNRVVFISYAGLDPADPGGGAYVRDVAAGTTRLLSRADGAAGAAADRASSHPRIAADGRHATFVTTATNLGAPGGTVEHAYRRGIDDGTTVLVDRADGASGAIADGNALHPLLSGDGRLVLFTSNATNLSGDDGRRDADLYLRDVAAGTTTLVSRRSGLDGVKNDGYTYGAALSADGRTVVFRSDDEQLAPEAGSWGGQYQLVARDLASGANTLVSRAPGGAPADLGAEHPTISADGGVIAFESNATNLLPGRGGAQRSFVVARDSASGALDGPPQFGSPGADRYLGAFAPSLSADGQCLSFTAIGHNAISGFAGDVLTGYVHVLSGSCPKPAAREQPPIVDPPPPPPPTRRGGSLPPEAPRVTNLSLQRRRFRVGARATAVSAARSGGRRGGESGRAKRRKATPAGTAFRFTLNVRANVTIALERSAPGRRVGRGCRRATPRLRRRKACTRWVATGTLTRNGIDGGRRSIAFSGRIGRKALAPGSYRATVTAGNAAGRSSAGPLRFTVVRR